MPYSNSHYALLTLFPLVLLAFWPGYFGQLGIVPFALHAHGLTATAWLMLLTWQSWTIHARRPAAHRAAGLATFVVVPLFAAGGLLAIRAMIQLAVERTDPFHIAFSMPLAMEDAVALIAFLILVCTAVAQRRRMHLHGAAMLSTALLVLPPIVGRLLPSLPGMPDPRTDLIWAFRLSFHMGETIAAVIALLLAWRFPRGAPPFLFTAAACMVQSVFFETVGKSAGWAAAGEAALVVPAPAYAAAGVAIGLGALLLAWRSAPARGRPRMAAA